MNTLVTDMLELVRPDLDLTVAEEIDRPTPCESPVHETQTVAHEGPGAFYLALDCGCPVKICCAKLVQRAFTLFDGKVICSVCNNPNAAIIAAVPLN
jgi:hypothetical protein